MTYDKGRKVISLLKFPPTAQSSHYPTSQADLTTTFYHEVNVLSAETLKPLTCLKNLLTKLHLHTKGLYGP